MESIDKLRRHVYDTLTKSAAYHINDMIDEIEREVANVVPLPVDADGVPIHVGDVMEWVDEPGITRTVTSIQLVNDGWWVYINGTGRRPDKYLHHHAPTVEDVLREMLVSAELAGGLYDADALIAECAAKLRLAGDAE